MSNTKKEPIISILDIERRLASGDLEAERLMGLILLDGTGVKKNVNEGFRLLRESAENGDSTSECDVGFCFHTGQGTDFNCSEAVRYYRLSADHSNAKGHNNLGYCLFNGEGTRADQKQAALHFKISADNNCAEGICNYARCLEYGDGVSQDYVKAAELYKKSADLNNAHAMYCYGRCLSNGIGVQKDDQLAFEYFRQSAEKHDEHGQLYYHLMLFKGRGIERDEVTAVNFFKREALAGNPHAQTYYGIALESGRGVANADVNKASMQYRMAADNGDPHGQFCLGMLFRNGKGVMKSEEEAARLFKQAADNGYGKAMVAFADCLNNGVGVAKFCPGAVSYYKAAAEKGKAVGQFMYAKFIEEGKFIEKNLSLAAHFYKLAANQHYAEAEFALGQLYEFGKGVKFDLEKAAELYKRAADQRLERAEDRYGKCLQRGRGALKSPILAVDFFRRSASQKFPPGQYHLGRSFETGLGISSGPDLSVAINNYKLAAAQNYPQALYHLGLLYKNGVKMKINPNISTSNNESVYSNSINYGKSSSFSNKYPSESLTKFMNFVSHIEIEDKNDVVENGNRIILEKNPAEAVKLFKSAALQNHTKSLYEYGMCLLYGNGIDEDIENAKNQFKQAASNGHVESMFMLSLISREIDKDENSAIKWLRDASNNSHSIAQCELGKFFYFQHQENNEKEMIDLFKKSANSGYADGLYWLGRVIEEKKDVSGVENINESSPIHSVVMPTSRLTVPQKAFICFSLSSKQLHPYATTRVGLYLLKGIGTELNHAAAIEMFEKAAKLGDSHAYYLLGRCHEFGEGINSNSSLASSPSVASTKSTTNVGNVERPPQWKSITKVKSITNINPNSNHNQNPNKNPPPSFQRNPRSNHLNPSSKSSSSCSSSSAAHPPMNLPLPPMNDCIHYYEKAAEAKDPCGLFSLGLMYARGIIPCTPSSDEDSTTNSNSDSNFVRKSNEAAMKIASALFAESSSLGSACGQMCYSCCLARGEGGLEQDMESAFQLALESKRKGIHWTNFGNSSFEFEDEDSFTRLLQEVIESDSSANSKKNKDLNLSVNIASKLINNPEKTDEALNILNDAVKKGHQGAMFILSTCSDQINTPQGEKYLIESAPWLERKQVKPAPPPNKKRKPSLKKIQMTKKSITSHHKALIQKPDGKHTFILV